jgi:hypothetical protein
MMLRVVVTFLFITISFCAGAQMMQVELTQKLTDGKMQLSAKGVDYFTQLSLQCVQLDTPHFNPKAINLEEHRNYKYAKRDWPSFYGCFDWHSAVNNHWALIKLLKNNPKNKNNPTIITRLEEAFNGENIQKELKYFKVRELEMFEFPYGTTWLLKVAEELTTWDNPLAKKWLANLDPLVQHIIKNYNFYWPKLNTPAIEGNHYNFGFGLSFAIDYARSTKKDTLEKTLVKAAQKYYGAMKNFDFTKEPFGYDFMSAGLLIADLMRKVYTQAEYETWLRAFAPKLLTAKTAAVLLKVVKHKKHDGFESHWDGYNLNRIWCLNGIMQSVSTNFVDAATKKQWIKSQEEMWNYAQESIGKGNYDIDHCLSSFSVFALEGYKK